MSWKDFVPFAGKRTVRSKLNDLEEKAGSLVIIFGTMFTKVFESIVTGKYILSLKFATAALVTAIVYIYRKEAIKKGKEMKEEVTEE